MGGENYTFCESCWYGPTLGKQLAILLGFYPHGLRLLRKRITLRTVPDGL